jgi:thiamine monophosphate kinase
MRSNEVNTILSDRRDDCVQIRRASGDAHVLTTDMLYTLSSALVEAERGQLALIAAATAAGLGNA